MHRHSAVASGFGLLALDDEEVALIFDHLILSDLEEFTRAECRNPNSALECFLHRAPVRCIESVARFLDLPSFARLVTLNSSLLQLCDSAALQPCWTHFAVVRRLLRHGENVLLPRLSPGSLPLLQVTAAGSRRRRRRGDVSLLADDETVAACQTFSRLLPRVTRMDFVRIGSLNSKWRNKSFSTEQLQVISANEGLSKAYVLATPPFESSSTHYCVAPDSHVNLQGPSVGLPACMQPHGPRNCAGDPSLFTVMPSTRVFAVQTAARPPRGQSVEVKIPLLPARIPPNPDPLIKFGGHAPKGWLLGEDEAPRQTTPAAGAGAAAAMGGPGTGARVSQSERKRQQRQQRQQQQLHRLHMTWVHVVPHPVHPCPEDCGSVRSRDGSPLLAPIASAATASAPWIGNSSSHYMYKKSKEVSWQREGFSFRNWDQDRA